MQFFFAYIANGTIAFDPDVHNVKDERVYGFSFAHNEGEFATLSLQVLNPHIGLLNAGRKQWIWASYQLDGSDDIVPFFKGRVVGLPGDMQKATLTLVYRGEPANYAATKLALAETLKVDPYWDEIFISPEDRTDPDKVIDANPVRYHIDPVTHAVTVSNISVGEDGTVVIDVDQQYVDTMAFGFGDPPLRRVDVKATVGWDQRGHGSIDLKSQLLRAFATAGSEAGLVTSFTGQGLQAAWPLPGDTIGAGWAFGLSQIGNPSIPSFNIHANDDVAAYLAALRSSDYGTMWRAVNSVRLPSIPEKVDERDGIIVRTLEDREASPQQDFAEFFIWKFAPESFCVSYLASRGRTEQLAFSLVAGVQEIVTDVVDVFTISIQSNAVSELAADGTTPIGDARRSSYFDTDRGKRSLRYLIALAARVLLVRARTANISLQVPFALMNGMSCRKNALVIDPRLPGGQGGGKVVGYGFSLDSNGVIKASVNIAGSLGDGESLPPLDDGSPTCADADAIGPDCQQFTGREISAIEGLASFVDYEADIHDDGLNLFHMRAETAIAGSRAKNKLGIGKPPADGDTIVVGADTYVWRDTIGDTANEILIGATTVECVFNFGSALIATPGLSGLLFGFETIASTLVTPSLSDKRDVLDVFAKQPGVAGNAISSSLTGNFGAWRDPTLTGGGQSPSGLRVINGVDVQRDILDGFNPPPNTEDPYKRWEAGGRIAMDADGNHIYTGEHQSDFTLFHTIEEAVTTLNDSPTRIQLQMVPISSESFNTDYDITVSDLVVPKTIDLEAASSP